MVYQKEAVTASRDGCISKGNTHFSNLNGSKKNWTHVLSNLLVCVCLCTLFICSPNQGKRSSDPKRRPLFVHMAQSPTITRPTGHWPFETWFGLRPGRKDPTCQNSAKVNRLSHTTITSKSSSCQDPNLVVAFCGHVWCLPSHLS